jgi:hypothetical protein
MAWGGRVHSIQPFYAAFNLIGGAEGTGLGVFAAEVLPTSLPPLTKFLTELNPYKRTQYTARLLDSTHDFSPRRSLVLSRRASQESLNLSLYRSEDERSFSTIVQTRLLRERAAALHGAIHPVLQSRLGAVLKKVKEYSDALMWYHKTIAIMTLPTLVVGVLSKAQSRLQALALAVLSKPDEVGHYPTRFSRLRTVTSKSYSRGLELCRKSFSVDYRETSFQVSEHRGEDISAPQEDSLVKFEESPIKEQDRSVEQANAVADSKDLEENTSEDARHPSEDIQYDPAYSANEAECSSKDPASKDIAVASEEPDSMSEDHEFFYEQSKHIGKGVEASPYQIKSVQKLLSTRSKQIEEPSLPVEACEVLVRLLYSAALRQVYRRLRDYNPLVTSLDSFILHLQQFGHANFPKNESQVDSVIIQETDDLHSIASHEDFNELMRVKPSPTRLLKTTPASKSISRLTCSPFVETRTETMESLRLSHFYTMNDDSLLKKSLTRQLNRQLRTPSKMHSSTRQRALEYSKMLSTRMGKPPSLRRTTTSNHIHSTVGLCLAPHCCLKKLTTLKQSPKKTETRQSISTASLSKYFRSARTSDNFELKSSVLASLLRRIQQRSARKLIANGFKQIRLGM